MNQVIDMRFEYEEIQKKISKFITWQESDEGRKVDLPEIEESHKDILFTDLGYTIKTGRKGDNDSSRCSKQYNRSR